MKEETIAEVRAETDAWGYLNELPEEQFGMRLDIKKAAQGDAYDIFSYVSDERRRSVTAYFHPETKEYKLRFRVGIMEFCEMEYITRELGAFESLLREKLPGFLKNAMYFDKNSMSVVALRKDFLSWDYSGALPEEAEGFSLFIRPSEPVRITNGSYIIIDYENFSAKSNFVIYYNTFRDEYFSEARIRTIPDINYEFDSRTVGELEKKLSEKLLDKLREINSKAGKN